MQAFVDRFRYKASKARQAQSRLKAIAKLEPIPAVIEAPHVVLRFPKPEVPPPPLITLEQRRGRLRRPCGARSPRSAARPGRSDCAARRQRQRQVDLREAAGRAARAWRRGDARAEAAGRLLAQHQIEALRPEDSALQHLARRLPAERAERLRTRLGGFGLTQDKADLPAGQLSGGEKARLTFALISAEAPQLLVLDEPTNHLDIDSRDALIEAINGFAAAVRLISHDPHLIELTADRLWLVEGGRVRPFDGDLEDYRRAP